MVYQEAETDVAPSVERRRLSLELVSSTWESQRDFQNRRRDSLKKTVRIEEPDVVSKSSDASESRRASVYTDVFARSSLSSEFVEKKLRPTSVMAMLFFEDPNPDINKVRNVLGERILAIPRFSAIFRLEDNKIYCDPIPQSTVDLTYHITTLDGQKRFDDEELANLIDEESNEYWDISKPLWSMRLVSNLKDGGSMLFCKFDHAIGDGVALLGVLRSIIDDPPSGMKSFQKKRISPPSLSWAHRVVTFFYGCYEGTIGSMKVPQDPDNGLKLPADATELKDRFSKTFTQTKAFPLKTIKEVKNKMEFTTVNDILMGIVTVGCREYLEKTKDPVVPKLKKGAHLQAQIVINSREGNETQFQMKNDIILHTLKLPMNYSDVVDAVWKNKLIVDEIKASPAIWLNKRMIRMLLPLLPEEKVIKTTFENARKPTAILSNVIGPSFKASLAGHPINDINFLVTSNIGLYIGMISYNDHVHLAFTADKAINIDTGLLKSCFEDAYDNLCDNVLKDPRPVFKAPDMTPVSAKVLQYFVVPIGVALMGNFVWNRLG